MRIGIIGGGVIARLTGILVDVKPHGVVLDVHGVGYELAIPLGTFIIAAGASQTAGTPFTVTLTATTNGVTTDTSYAGVKTSLLYAVRHTSFYADDRRLHQFLALLEEKERNPADLGGLEGVVDVVAVWSSEAPALEALVVYIKDEVVRPNLGEKDAPKWLPFFLTMFFFFLMLAQVTTIVGVSFAPVMFTVLLKLVAAALVTVSVAQRLVTNVGRAL